MKRAGFLALFHMLILRTGPDPISPYLLRAALEGIEAALTIDHAFMRLVDPSLYSSLRPWLEFERGALIPSDPADDLVQLMMQADIDVRCCLLVPRFDYSSLRPTGEGYLLPAARFRAPVARNGLGVVSRVRDAQNLSLGRPEGFHSRSHMRVPFRKRAAVGAHASLALLC